MKYLVAYAFEQGFGNVECEFGHNPPTMADITDAEIKIMKQGNWTQKPVIINFIPISN